MYTKGFDKRGINPCTYVYNVIRIGGLISRQNSLISVGVKWKKGLIHVMKEMAVPSVELYQLHTVGTKSPTNNNSRPTAFLLLSE